MSDDGNNDEGDATKSNEKLTFLVFHNSVRPYTREEITRVFTDMRAEFPENIDPKRFRAAASSFGTHLPKLVSPRASLKDSPVVEFAPSGGRNLPYQQHASGNAGDSKYAKAIMRPIAITEVGERSFVDHLQAPDEITDVLNQAFVAAFGADALAAVQEGLEQRKTALDRMNIPGSDYPVFFVPGPDRCDLQTSPISSGEVFRNLQNLRGELFEQHKQIKDKPEQSRRSLFVDWIGTEVSAKLQNTAPSLGGKRWRFLARFHTIGSAREAALRAFLYGGPFPRWYDEDMPKRVVDYLKALKFAEEDYSNQAIRRGLKQRADFIISRAQLYIEDTLEEAAMIVEENIDPEARRPKIWEVVARLPFEKDDRRVIANIDNILQDDHFNRRVQEAEHKS